MKKMKKILSAILAIAMLMSMIVLPVSAEETMETISVGETKAFTLNSEETLEYLFVPTESCRYIVYLPDASQCYPAVIDNSNGMMHHQDIYWQDAENGISGMAYDLTAGVEYGIWIAAEAYTESSISSEVTIIKAERYQTLSFAGDITGTVGSVVYCDINLTPVNASETLYWEFETPNIADIYPLYNSPEGFALQLLNAGTTNLTVSTESGLTATCEVTVKEMETITVGETKPISLAPGENAQFKFTPAESGRYIAYRHASDSFGMEFLNSTGEWVPATQWFDTDISFWGNAADLTAGEEYTIAVYNWNDNNTVNSALNLAKAEAVESISFEKDSYTFFTGTYQDIHLDIEPYFGCEEVVYTSSNPAVAEIEGEDSMGVGLNLIAVGTSDITATTASGKTASCTVVVTEMPTIDIGTTSVTVPAEGSMEYSFTPAESGNYLFYIPNGIWSLGISAK